VDQHRDFAPIGSPPGVSITILVPKPETPQRLMQSLEQVWGPKHTSLAGSRVDDLVQNGKMVMLCSFCDPKFNPRRNKYVPWSRTWLPNGQCDGCKTHGSGLKAFIPESNYDAVAVHEPSRGPRWRRMFSRRS
jgi:hypothetical protein